MAGLMDLRKLRMRRKMHLRDLANKFGISVPRLSDIELGRADATPEEMEKINNFIEGEQNEHS